MDSTKLIFDTVQVIDTTQVFDTITHSKSVISDVSRSELIDYYQRLIQEGEDRRQFWFNMFIVIFTSIGILVAIRWKSLIGVVARNVARSAAKDAVNESIQDYLTSDDGQVLISKLTDKLVSQSVSELIAETNSDLGKIRNKHQKTHIDLILSLLKTKSIGLSDKELVFKDGLSFCIDAVAGSDVLRILERYLASIYFQPSFDSKFHQVCIESLESASVILMKTDIINRSEINEMLKKYIKLMEETI